MWSYGDDKMNIGSVHLNFSKIDSYSNISHALVLFNKYKNFIHNE